MACEEAREEALEEAREEAREPDSPSENGWARPHHSATRLQGLEQ